MKAFVFYCHEKNQYEAKATDDTARHVQIMGVISVEETLNLIGIPLISRTQDNLSVIAKQ